MRLLLLTAALAFYSSSCSAVILLSLRAGAEATHTVAGPDDLHIFSMENDLWLDSNQTFITDPFAAALQIDQAELTRRLENKRVLVLIHGMAKNVQSAQKDFFNGLWSLYLSTHSSDAPYDEVVLVSWPGTKNVSFSGFVKANGLARKSGGLLSSVIQEWNQAGASVTAITHSMGSKVICKALKDGAKLDALHLLAPSVARWSLQPWGRWHKTFARIEGKVSVYYSRKDWALSFTAFSKIGLGYRGIGGPASRKLTQHDCTDYCNQTTWEALPRNGFRTRSNHSMYWQALPVWSLLFES